MGAFLAVRGADARAGALLARLDAAMREQGFAEPAALRADGVALRLYGKQAAAHANLYRRDEHNFCASTGTLLYRGRSASEALAALHADLAAGAVAWERLFGSFCALACHDGRLRLFTDRIGTYPVWRDGDWRVVSSSFLAAAAACTRPTADAQAVYEYVFQGAAYGGASPIAEIGRLDPGRIVSLGETVAVEERAAINCDPPEGGTLGAHVERTLARLRVCFADLAAAFGDRVDTALSGGYDSRLILALLRAAGIGPRIHVYGAPGEDDVRIAAAVAAGEGVALEAIDKGARAPVPAEDFAALIERNFRGFDGWPADGIFDNGADLTTRAERCAGGRVMLNGGGGEVFRNFFYLPDRGFSVRALLWAFYSRFDPACCTAAFDERAYHAALGAKIRRTLGIDRDRLTRTEIEALYALFRCRYWMGRNNAVNNRFGCALTPLVEPTVLAATLKVPIRFKSHGRLEAAMIATLDPRLASYPSAYGHAFDRPPPLAHVLKDTLTYWRPPRLRRYAFRLKTRARPPLPYWLEDAWVGRALDPSLPYMRRFFRPERVFDPGQLNRLYTLEYLFERLQPALG